MLPLLFPGHKVPPKWNLHHCFELLPKSKPGFLFVCVYKTSPAADPAGDTALPLSPRGRDTGRMGRTLGEAVSHSLASLVGHRLLEN